MRAGRELLRWVARMQNHPVRNIMFILSGAVVAWCGFLGYWLSPASPAQVITYKVVILAALVSTLAFIAVYSGQARWWRNPIGRTIVLIDVEVFVALVPIALSLFFSLSRVTSEIAAGLDLAAIGSIPVTMCWRTWVWIQLRRLPGQDDRTPQEDHAS
jgi:hypothetical protein